MMTATATPQMQLQTRDGPTSYAGPYCLVTNNNTSEEVRYV
jgi:hypothetical protein